nr:HEPACAM family member 2-like [Oncorhynchus nerka]
MEGLGRRTFIALCLYTALLTLSEVNSEIVHIPSVLYGVKGKSLLLSVETYFRLEDVEIQGSWYQTRPGGPKTLLVTFHNHTAIMLASMRHRKRYVFQPPNASLLIPILDEAAEGDYHLDLDIHFPQRQELVRAERTVHVTVDVPVSTPVIQKTPSSTVVEDKENVNMDMRDNWTYAAWPGNQHSQRGQSHTLDLSVFYGPYNLAVKSDHGLRTGEVFTVNPGELVFFDCQADSNPPNSCMWISKTNNATEVITVGLRLEVTSYKLAQAEEFLCRAFNNVTQKQDETQFTLVVASLGTGKERYVQESRSFSPLAAITLSCLFISCMLLVYFRRSCHHPKRVLMNIYNRPLTEQRRPHRSGHEDATEDFGIYEFVSIPGKMESTQASSRSLAHLESVQDLHTTIYDVIRHIPETPTLATQSLLGKQCEG